MEKTSEIFQSISEGTNRYVQLQAKSIKLEIYERVTNIIASGISAAFIAVFALFCFLFVNLGLAFWLSEVLQSNKLGFFALGGFYFVILGLYLIFKNKIAKNKVKDAVLLKVSKTMNNYNSMMRDQVTVHAQVALAEEALKKDFNELKENLQTLKDDFNRIKSNFVSNDKDEAGEEHVGPKIPRIAVTSAIDFVLQNFVFKNGGLIKKTLLPIITNALVTSSLFKETKKTSLMENIKLKFSKFL